jgi:membrane protein implicated in regulation of membrane protease activity
MALPWWAWVILAGLLGLAELHAPGGYLIWIALGAAMTSAVHAAFGTSLEGQLATFVIGAALSCGVGYFVYRHLPGRRHGEPALNQRHLEMVGARGIVCEAFRNGQGKIRLGDTVWLATGPDLADGAPVTVTAVHGVRLVVQPVREAAAPA